MEIETKRLLLRPLRDDDAPVMARRLNNFEISKFLSRVPFPCRLEDACAFIKFQRDYDARSKVCAIAFKCAPDEIQGIVAYEYSAEKEETEFGYWLSECCWGQRIMTEAANAVVNYALTEGKVETLHAGYWNPISGKLLANLGFKVTHHAASYCLAQKKDMPSTKVILTRDQWRLSQC